MTCSDNVDANILYVNYQPGNCTAYKIVYLPEHSAERLRSDNAVSPGAFMVSWLNGPNGGGACVLQSEGFLSAGYVQENLGGSLADAHVLAELIAHYTRRTAESAEEVGHGPRG